MSLSERLLIAQQLTRSTRSWTTVTQLIALNTPPLANGLLYVYINNTLVLAQTGLVWRTDEKVILSRVLFSTFFGGSSKSYLPSRDQVAYFKDFKVSSALDWRRLKGEARRRTRS